MRLLFTSAFLGLGWFAAVNVLASGVAWVLTQYAVRRSPVPGASWLLALRLLPATLSLTFAGALFLPAHVWFEPRQANESFGIILAGLAILGSLILGGAVWRGGRVALSEWHLRSCLARLPETAVGAQAEPCEIQGFDGLSLAGVFGTRILIGSRLRAMLTPAELDVALDHERAHRTSRDNLKRVAMFCTPDIFGWSGASSRLEIVWRAQAERLADARAVAGDDRRALHLASALVKVARLKIGSGDWQRSPVWSTFHEPPLLEARVRWLVAGGMPPVIRQVALHHRVAAAVGGLAACALWILDGADHLHRATETLVRLLP